MKYKPSQRDIVFIDFDPAKGFEVKKRRPTLVLSRIEYNRASNIVIVCLITTTSKERPFLVPIEFVENMSEEQFYHVAQKFMYNFSFKI